MSRTCACGLPIKGDGRNTSKSQSRKHRDKTGCQASGVHIKTWSRHCVDCGRSL